MRTPFFAMALLCSHIVFAGERCIAIDGDTLVCNHQKVRLTNVYAAELNQAGNSSATAAVRARRSEPIPIREIKKFSVFNPSSR